MKTKKLIYSFQTRHLVSLKDLSHLVLQTLIINLLKVPLQIVLTPLKAFVDLRQEHNHDLLVILPLLVVNGEHVYLVFHPQLNLFHLSYLLVDLLYLSLLHCDRLPPVVISLFLEGHLALLRILDGKDALLKLRFVENFLFIIQSDLLLLSFNFRHARLKGSLKALFVLSQLVIKLFLQRELLLADLVFHLCQAPLQSKEGLLLLPLVLRARPTKLPILLHVVILDICEELVNLDEVGVRLLALHFVLQVLDVFLQLLDLVLHLRDLLPLLTLNLRNLPHDLRMTRLKTRPLRLETLKFLVLLRDLFHVSSPKCL